MHLQSQPQKFSGPLSLQNGFHRLTGNKATTIECRWLTAITAMPRLHWQSHLKPPPLLTPLNDPLAVWMLFAFYICQVFIARYSRGSNSLSGQKDGSCGKIMRLINMRVQCECATPPMAALPPLERITVYFDSLMCVLVGGYLFAFSPAAVVVIIWPANTHQNGKFAHCQSQRIVNDYNDFLLCEVI